MLITTFNKTDSVVQFLTLLIIFVFVIAITYVTVKWTSKIQQGQSKYSNIEIVETKRITNNKYLQIVKAGDKYLLIGIGKDEINLITELQEEELLLRGFEDSSFSFAQVLDKIKSQNNKEDNKID